MYELSARNDNVILYDKRNQKHYILDSEDVDQIVDNNNKLRSDEVIEKYLKFKTEPVVVQQQLKAADIKEEYEAMRELYEPKVSTQIIDNFINKFKLSNDEIRKLEAFPDSKTIDTFNRDEVVKNNMKKEFKIMVEKLKKDTNIKTDPFLYMKYYFGTKIIKSDNVFIQQQLSNLLKEPWKYADLNYITPEEIENLKRHAPYKNLASLVFSVRRPIFDGINFMKIMSLLKIYDDLKKNYFNNDISKTNYKSVYTEYNKNDKYLNFNIWSKNEDNKIKNKKISFSVKNRILYIFNIKGFKQIYNKEYFKETLKSITPKIYALIKYLLISEPSENHYKITINLFGDFNDYIADEAIFSDNYLIYKIEKNNNGRAEQIRKKSKTSLWDNKNFKSTIDEFKEFVEMSDTEREITNEMNKLMKPSSDDSTQDDDSSSTDYSPNDPYYVKIEKKEDNSNNNKLEEIKEIPNDIPEIKPIDENKVVDYNNDLVNDLSELHHEYHEEEKQKNNRNLEKINKLMDYFMKKGDMDKITKINNALSRDAKNAADRNDPYLKITPESETFKVYDDLNYTTDGEMQLFDQLSEGRLKLYSSGWTDKTLTRIDDLLTQLKKSSGYNIPKQHFALGWTDKTLTRIDNLLTQLK